MDGSGGVTLQSGFVLAAIIFAVLAADRLGGSDEIVRRIHQVAFGLLLTLTVVAGTMAFVRPPDLTEELSVSDAFGDGEDEDEQIQYFRDIADRNVTATTIHAGAGAALLIAGLFALRQYRTMAMGGVLGGLLLILFGGVRAHDGGAGSDGIFGLFSLYGSLLSAVGGGSSRELDIAYFTVLLLSAAAVGLVGYIQWDEPKAMTEPTLPAE